MRLLGLGETARLPEIKHAYRQLAQQLHPDKHPGSESARQRFIEVAKAYRTLVRAARAAEAGRPVGTCVTCLSFGEVLRGLDGLLHCPRCAVRGQRRYLPLPVIVVVRCTLSIVLLAGSAYLSIYTLRYPALAPAVGAFALGLLGLLTLAITCMRVGFCVRPPRAR